MADSAFPGKLTIEQAERDAALNFEEACGRSKRMLEYAAHQQSTIGWQPMDKAPLSGQKIILLLDGSPGIYRWRGGEWYGVMDKPISLDSDCPPTAWASIPA